MRLSPSCIDSSDSPEKRPSAIRRIPTISRRRLERPLDCGSVWVLAAMDSSAFVWRCSFVPTESTYTYIRLPRPLGPSILLLGFVGLLLRLDRRECALHGV